MNRIAIFYPTLVKQIDLTEAEIDLINNRQTNVVTLIKFVRAQYGLGLYDSKSIVDTVRRNEDERKVHVAKFG
jgi:ribosomal protein L7/L12